MYCFVTGAHTKFCKNSSCIYFPCSLINMDNILPKNINKWDISAVKTFQLFKNKKINLGV